MRLKLKISPFFFVLIFLSFLSGTALQCFIYILIVILHELAHFVTADKLGYKLNTLHLMPYGAALSGNSAPMSYKDEIIIAMAGPLFNLICAVFFVALWWITPTIYSFTDTVVWANIGIAAFNFLPVYPLDGGRILKSLLTAKFSHKQTLRALKIISLVICVIFTSGCILLAFRGIINFSIATAAIFIMASTFVNDKEAYYQFLYSMTYRTEKIKRGLTVKEIMVFGDETIASLIKMISSVYYTRFNLVDSNIKSLGVITETELLELAGKSDQNLSIYKAIKINDLKSF